MICVSKLHSASVDTVGAVDLDALIWRFGDEVEMLSSGWEGIRFERQMPADRKKLAGKGNVWYKNIKCKGAFAAADRGCALAF